MFFSQAELNEIDGLLAEGFRRLDRIENDIHTLLRDSEDSKNPFAATIKRALDEICPDAQLLALKKSRAGLKFVRAKLELEEFSDSDAEEVCRVLDDLKAVGVKLSAAAQTYKSHIQQCAEHN